MRFLSITMSDGTSFRQPFDGDAVRIGRSSGNDLVLHDQGASRHHAEIVSRPDGVFIIDEHSRNHTYLNGRPIAGPMPLQQGDSVRIGSTLVVFNETFSGEYNGADRDTDDPTTGSPRRGSSLTPPAIEAAIPVTRSVVSMGTITPPRGDPATVSAEAIDAILFKADRHLAFHRPLEQILEAVMDLAHEAVVYERGLLLRYEGGRLVPRVVRCPDADENQPVQYSETIVSHVLANHEAVLSRDTVIDPRFQESYSIGEMDIRSVICVPLWNNREVLGLIYVDTCHAERRFTERDLQVMAFLANIAAVKIDNHELFNRAIEMQGMQQLLHEAGAIQKRMLPATPPEIKAYTIVADSLPCYEVGGDLYDYHVLPDGRCCLGLGDVAGKGLPAALIMSNFTATIRTLCELHLPPEEMFNRLNNLIFRSIPDNRYVTFFYGLLDPAQHTLTYVNAGHPAPLRIRRDGDIEPLELNNIFIGSLADRQFKAASVRFDPGDLLVCYSDGVTEQVNPGGEEFGEARLRRMLKGALGRSPHDLLESIVAAVDDHADSPHRQDDLTLLILKRND